MNLEDSVSLFFFFFLRKANFRRDHSLAGVTEETYGIGWRGASCLLTTL